MSLERFSYDPFGKRRQSNGLDDPGSYQAGTNLKSTAPNRGYTGHEMLDDMGIVHMNGRLYDPRLGRVMSADPIIQAPGMSQSYNRYSYCINSPLSLTDPSGYSWWTSFRDKWLKPIAAIAVAIYAPQISGYLWGAEFGVATACYASVSASTVAMVQGATAGFLAGAITGGTLESAFYGGISGAAFGGLHAGMDAGVGVGKVLAHGMAGGIMGAAQGGDFGSSFLSAAFTQGASQANMFGNPGADLAMRVQNAVAAAIVGGTAAALGGGKFANGAVTGAMSRLLNVFAPGSMSSPESDNQGLSDTKADQMGGAALKIGASLLPGAGGAECYFDGCGALGWGIAAIDALPGGKGFSALGKYSANDVHHLFGRGGEVPAQLIERFGSAEAALGSLHTSAQAVATSAYVTGSWVALKLEGIAVTFKGAVIDGTFRISSIAKRPF